MRILPQLGLELGHHSSKPLANRKEGIEKEIKKNLKTLKKERRLLENYLWFFQQTLPLEEVKIRAQVIDQKRSAEGELKELYRKLKRTDSEEDLAELKQDIIPKAIQAISRSST